MKLYVLPTHIIMNFDLILKPDMNPVIGNVYPK